MSPPPPTDDPYEGFQEVSARLMEIYGYYPSPGDRHVAEFFPFFLRRHRQRPRLRHAVGTGHDEPDSSPRVTSGGIASPIRPRDVPSSTARLFDEAREGERVVSIMEAIVTDRPLLELAVNVRNDGLIPNLPAEAVVEVPGLIDGRGVHGIPVGALPEGIAGILNARVRQQELTVDAALSRRSHAGPAGAAGRPTRAVGRGRREHAGSGAGGARAVSCPGSPDALPRSCPVTMR